MIRLVFLLSFALLSSSLFGQVQREFEMKQGDSTIVLKQYWMCMLYSGKNHSIDSTEASKIQTAHLERITELKKQGIIKIAGPFDSAGDLRGIFIYDVDTKKEAEKYANSDPAIQAGSLRYEIFSWWTLKGSTLD